MIAGGPAAQPESASTGGSTGSALGTNRPQPVCAADYRDLAAQVLPAQVWDFIQGGSGDELTLRANRAALDLVAVLPRMLSGVATTSTATRLMGTASALPLAVAPMAYQQLIHPDAEAAMARAARRAGVPFTVSTISSRPIEEIAETGADLWFQLYWLRDRELVAQLVERAERVGSQALMVTVDVPVMARRRRDLRNAFTLPPWATAGNLSPAGETRAHQRYQATSAIAAHTNGAFDPTLRWEDLAWLRERTRLPLVLKGILDPADAARAAQEGADAIVVSNHGGRQLDAALASAAALPGVAEAVAGRCQVLVDSGIRSGTDILRALALGADGVLIGRPLLWGLAVAGEEGVSDVLGMLGAELADAFTLSGCSDPRAVRALRTVVQPPVPWPR